MVYLNIDFNNKNPQVEWLPLDYFDDTTFDDNEPDDWLKRMYDE